MTRKSKRDLENEIEDLASDREDGGGPSEVEVCCSWKDDCDHDSHDIVVDFNEVET